MKTLISNGTIVTAFPGTGNCDPVVIPDGGVLVDGDRVSAVGRQRDLEREHPGVERLDARGGVIVPGFVNLHHHFYSALARGLDPGRRMNSFAEVLDVLWWRLDRALDAETVRLSAELSLAECARWGCTTVFDHHASPSSIEGSLDLIAEAVEAAGLSAVLCYEVTDRNGAGGACAGREENLRFIRERSGHPRVRGVFGLHASFTVGDETLAAVAAERDASMGCHIHVAEDPVDVEASRAAFGEAPLARLSRFGLLDDRSLLAHCIHLAADDYRTIGEHGAVILHNPESNANNGVGRLDTVVAAECGAPVGLGTDGMSSSMLRAWRAAFLAHRSGTGEPDSGFTTIPDLLGTNATVARRFLDEPLLGELAPGAPADMAVIDVPAPTPLGPENVFGHLVYGIAEGRVRHTVARGEIVLDNFELTHVDGNAIAARAREATPELWARFRAQPTGTNFLGDSGTE